MSRLSVDQLLERLPPKKDFWFSSDIAKAMGVSSRTIQRAAKRENIGRKVRHSIHGMYIFMERDLIPLCEHIYREVGNPVNIAKSRGELF